MNRRAIGSCAVAGALVLGLTECGSRTPLDVGLELSADAGTDSEVSLPCIPGAIPLSRAEPAVMLVLDRSMSMRSRIPTPSGTSARWTVLTEALAATLPSIDGSANIGALLFPSRGAGVEQCSVPSTVDFSLAKGQVGSLVTAMRETTPSGSTPTADAIDSAARSLSSFRAASTARSLVVATDGAPACNASLDPATCQCVGGRVGRCGIATRCLDDVRTVERIASWAARGLPTYVVGIAAQNEVTFRNVLDAMAAAGGRARPDSPRYYSAGSETELTSALAAIRDQVGTCTFLTSSVPSDRGEIIITANGVTIPFDENGTTGWRWGVKGNGEILLASNACGGANPSSLVANVRCEALDASTDARAPSDARADTESD